MKCSICGYENDNNARFCEKCGSELKQAGNGIGKSMNNPFIDKARTLLLAGFLGFDLILSTVCTLLGIGNLPVYAASALAYILCIVFSVRSYRWIRIHCSLNASRSALTGTFAVGITAGLILIMNAVSLFRYFTGNLHA